MAKNKDYETYFKLIYSFAGGLFIMLPFALVLGLKYLMVSYLLAIIIYCNLD